MLITSKGWFSERIIVFLTGVLIFAGSLGLPLFVFRQSLRGEQILQNFCQSHKSLPCGIYSIFYALLIILLLAIGIQRIVESLKQFYFDDEKIIFTNLIKNENISFLDIKQISLSDLEREKTLTIYYGNTKLSYFIKIQGEKFTHLLLKKIRDTYPSIVIQGTFNHTNLE